MVTIRISGVIIFLILGLLCGLQLTIVYPADSDFGEVFDQVEKLERRFYNTVFKGQSEAEATHYDAVLNSGRLSFESMFKLVDELVLERQIQKELDAYQSEEETGQLRQSKYFELKNESEREFARLLDLYRIEWRYEPKTFPIDRDMQGRVTLAFSPDFYLPRFKLFIELTTMKQSYVSIKKQKLKKLQELYPDVRCKIVYKKDFEALFKRFEASGTIND